MSGAGEDKKTFTGKQTLGILIRAYKIIHEIRPWFLSLTASVNVLDALKPLIALFMSARIINELYGARDVQKIVIYAVITVITVFLLSIAAALMNKLLNLINEYNFFDLELLYMKRYMEIDYQYTEDGRVTQMLSDIRARANGNGLGIMNLFWLTPSLIRNFTTLAASFAMLLGIFTFAQTYIQ